MHIKINNPKINNNNIATYSFYLKTEIKNKSIYIKDLCSFTAHIHDENDYLGFLNINIAFDIIDELKVPTIKTSFNNESLNIIIENFDISNINNSIIEKNILNFKNNNKLKINIIISSFLDNKSYAKIDIVLIDIKE